MTREEIEREIQEIERSIEIMTPTDEELLEWAREHHPQMERVRELLQRLTELQSLLETVSDG